MGTQDPDEIARRESNRFCLAIYALCCLLFFGRVAWEIATQWK